MATYKVLQDIEAEDKLIGPLTLRQFIYGLVAAFNGYLTFLFVSKGAPFLVIISLPLMALCGFFAWPWGRDQPTEVWALAKVRFLVKPRKRIWNQDGIIDLVSINVPKYVEKVFTNGLSEYEVQSRLKALATTIDSRGWAIKNAGINGPANSDRLVTFSNLPQPVPSIDIKASDDILDESNSLVAQHFSNMIDESTKAHRQEVIDRLNMPVQQEAQGDAPQTATMTRPANDYWFLNNPTPVGSNSNSATFNTQVVAPGAIMGGAQATAATPTAAEESFIKQLKSEPLFSPNARGHLHVIQPLSEQKQGQQQNQSAPQPIQQPQPVAPTPPSQSSTQQVTPGPDAGILDLVRNNDLNVATIAREAQKRKDSPQDEIVISLH